MKQTRYKILLVEDDRLDQMAFARSVETEKLPYDCQTVASVAQARTVLARDRFDVVISDYELGDGTALDILHLVKDTPVILVTGAGNEDVAVNAWRAGAYNYLVKDLERNYLKTVPITIQNAVEHWKTKQQAQLLSAAVMSTSDSVYITDLQGRFIFVNRAFCKNYGYQQDEIIGQSSHILWMEKSRSNPTRSVFGTMAGAGSCGVAFYHRRKDGAVFPVSLSRSIVKDTAGNSIAVVGVARDISELVDVEDRVEALSQKLQQANRVVI